jgi:hypothetical protein
LLSQQKYTDAKNVLLTQLKYFTSEAQMERMEKDVTNPNLVLTDKNGQMNAVHIRFNAKSQNFDDVYENGQPQPWNHKQNDALGLVL